MLDLAPESAGRRQGRWRSADRDGLRQRQRLDRTLARVDWHLPGVAPTAILLVRKLATATRMSGATFGAAVRNELVRYCERARRPWVHDDAGAAEAVLFLDERELAACLVRDWLSGRARDRWWWPVVLEAQSIEIWLRRNVLGRGEWFAATCGLLASHSLIVPWYHRFDAPDVAHARTALARTYGIRSRDAPDDEQPLARAVVGPLEIRDEGVTIRAHAALRTLFELVPELIFCDLARGKRQLLAISLAVQRRLPWARSDEFTRACAALPAHARAPDREEAVRRSRLADTPDEPAEKPVACESRVGHENPEETGRPRPPARRVDESPAAARSRVDADADARPAEAPAEPAPLADESRTRLATPLPEMPRTIDADAVALPDAGVVTATHAIPGERISRAGQSPAVPERRATPAPPVLPIGLPVPTDFGGIFYLLNVALALGLYGDFTMPRLRGIDLSPWDWLAAIGRRWFGDEFRKDSAWKLLANLAGHPPRRQPERGFVPPPPGEVDLPIRARNARRWFDGLSAHLIGRIGRAIGADDLRQVPARVCRHRAHIYMSATAVDVHLSLGDLPIELRAGGLDRDPGWIPAAGRSVRFHFQ